MTIVLQLVSKMMARSQADALPASHPMRVRGIELDDACQRRFFTHPVDCSVCHYVDCYKRAYAAWHAHTGEDS